MAQHVPDGEQPTLRRPLLVHALLSVLRDAGGPVSAAEALARVEQTLSFNAHETSQAAGGVQLAETFLRFASSWATTLGWMTKKGDWALTEAGADPPASPQTHPGPDKHASHRSRRCREPAQPVLNQGHDLTFVPMNP